MSMASKLVQRIRKGLLGRLKLMERFKEGGGGIGHEDERRERRRWPSKYFGERRSMCKGSKPERNLDFHISGVV